MISDRDQRITKRHLSRAAIVYVRQSSVQQVRDHAESTRVQLGLRERAIALGWCDPSVIDDDLGMSAGGYVDRPGFQGLLGAVAMQRVGIILSVDASRLSRNSTDWAQLFELCSHFDTLIADQEQVYDLRHPNDRLVMGVKGTVSEMELTIIRSRLLGGKEAKAARGELKFQLPAGYVHDADGRIVLDPDKRVRTAVETFFERFARFTSVRQLALWYQDTHTLFPVKKVHRNAEIRWEVPVSKTIYKILNHPIYAGAYVWGRRFTKVDYVDGKLVKRVGEGSPIEEWPVCIRDHHAAYISWDRYLENCARISDNRPVRKMQENRGAIREGLALLVGMLRCRQCGGRIRVAYKAESALYYCDGGYEKGSKRCLSFGSKAIDVRVGEELSRAVEPFAIEAAVTAAESSRAERAQEIEDAQLALEAAQYQADRAFEQFDRCDPKNRLVADTLEQRLNAKLGEIQSAKARLEKLRRDEDDLTESQRQRLHELARDFPGVWNHPKADPKLKKQLLRAAIEEILVKEEPEEKRLEVIIHWRGGVHSRIHVLKRAKPQGNQALGSLLQLVRKLVRELPDNETARILNMQKIQTPKGLCWTQDRVMEFRKHHRIKGGVRNKSPDHLTMNEAKAYLEISHNGLLGLVRIGAIATNQVTEFAPWRVSRQELDSDHVRACVRALKATGRLPRGDNRKEQLTLFADGN